MLASQRSSNPVEQYIWLAQDLFAQLHLEAGSRVDKLPLQNQLNRIVAEHRRDRKLLFRALHFDALSAMSVEEQE